jgi:histone deacetylase 1/2
MTCSLHKFKDYFPGTGHKDDIGYKNGKFHAVNFPLSEGMDDESYMGIFKPVIDAIYEYYRPEAVVM